MYDLIYFGNSTGLSGPTSPTASHTLIGVTEVKGNLTLFLIDSARSRSISVPNTKYPYGINISLMKCEEWVLVSLRNLISQINRQSGDLRCGWPLGAAIFVETRCR